MIHHDLFMIAGGGLGGLTAALGLARKGRNSIVLEQAPQLGEFGAGIQLAPNAFHAFDQLAVGDKARRGAVFVESLVLMDALKDEAIVTLSVGDEFRKRFGNPYAVVHRADLHTALLEACVETGLVELRVNSRVERYTQDADTITAVLANGDTVTGRALIGADGQRSKVREQLVGDGPPIVAGHTTYRSVIPTEQMPKELRWNTMALWAGPGVHLVHYPLKGGEVFNLAITSDNGAREPAANVPISKEGVRKHFMRVAPRAQQIIDCGQDWKYWVLCDREPIENWVDGRATLLGDAAHPMLQNMAQGACMAIEDGVFLAHAIEQFPGDIPGALKFYNKGRAVRTARVQTGSRLMAQYVFHPTGAMATVRNATLRSKTQAQHYDDLAWLYQGQPLPRADDPHPRLY